MNASLLIIALAFANLFGIILLQLVSVRAVALKLLPDPNYRIALYWFVPVVNILAALVKFIYNEYRAIKIKMK